ncbi:hypothetical protein PVAP13_3NG093160 [Panicum virgatum]|uniref:Uncharacterized protein n=1 Tax=Panicum virgatum TaxID=38727 RepID=A0A8T0UEM4_PANVG|nr:hypothetical protein PVAP13_3NG093160 [Panicum virgatum]
MDTVGAAIPVEDDVPGERILVYDPNNPCMDIGTVYPNMEEFRAKKQPENESGQPPVTTPTRTRETILQESPNRLTRRQLSILMEEETCARPQPTHNLMGEGTMATNKRTARKLIPRKRTS